MRDASERASVLSVVPTYVRYICLSAEAGSVWSTAGQAVLASEESARLAWVASRRRVCLLRMFHVRCGIALDV